MNTLVVSLCLSLVRGARPHVVKCCGHTQLFLEEQWACGEGEGEVWGPREVYRREGGDLVRMPPQEVEQVEVVADFLASRNCSFYFNLEEGEEWRLVEGGQLEHQGNLTRDYCVDHMLTLDTQVSRVGRGSPGLRKMSSILTFKN